MGNMKLVKNRITDEVFINACNKAVSMSAAAAELNLHFNSFKKRALELGCYFPNQAGKGVFKKAPKIPLSDIVQKGQYPHYQTYKLKKRMIAEGLKPALCEKCQIKTWLGKPLQLELHHRDGNRKNHLLHNLELLCPNCHSQTDTFRAKNKKI